MLFFAVIALCLTGEVGTARAVGDPLGFWHWKNPLPHGNQINGLAYGNNRFVAVGDYGTILISDDGATWEPVSVSNIKTSSGVAIVPTDVKSGAYWLHLKGITYGSGKFVAVGDAEGTGTAALSTVLTSADGLNWTRQADVKDASSKPVSAALRGVASGTQSDGINVFYAVGAKGTILSSADGIQWRASATTPTTNNLNAITYSNYTFVAVGENGTVVTLLNSGKWLVADSTVSAITNPPSLNSVASGPNNFVVAGASGTVLNSPDGISWTKAPTPTTENLNTVVYDGTGTYVAAGDKGIRLSSPDGATWVVQVAATAGVPGIICSSFGGFPGSKVFAVAGAGGSIITSPNGTVWTPYSLGYKHNITGIAYGLDMYIAVTDSGKLLTAPYDGVTTFGTTWTESSPAMTRLNGIAFANSMFVAVGNSGKILISYDGSSWSDVSSGSYNLNGIVHDGSRFVVVGNSGTILTSPDGAAWLTVSSGTTKHFYAVTVGGDKSVVAVGQGGVVATSTFVSGAWGTWKIAAAGSKDLLGVAASHSSNGTVYYAAVGTGGTIMTVSAAVSTPVDFSKWSVAKSLPANYKTADLLSVASDGNDNYGTFVALGAFPVTGTANPVQYKDSALLISMDGSNWSERYPLTAGKRDNGKINAALYANKAYLIGGDGGSLLMSDRLDRSIHFLPRYDFGVAEAGQPSFPVSFSVTNQGFEKLNIANIAMLAGTDYSLSPVNCGDFPFDIGSGSSCSFNATFNPILSGLRTDTLRVTSDDPLKPSADSSFSGIGGMHVLAAAGPNGAITSADIPAIPNTPINGMPAYLVTPGSSPAFSITPDAGYYVQEVRVNGFSIGSATSYLFPPVVAASRSLTLEAVFSNLLSGKHYITVTSGVFDKTGKFQAGLGGVVSPPGITAVTDGDTQAFSITPAIGYEVDSIEVDGTVISPTSLYTFSAVSSNHTLHVVFKLKRAIVTSSLITNRVAGGSGGTITEGAYTPQVTSCSKAISGNVTAYTCDFGAGIPYDFAPKSGYRLVAVMLDGVSQVTALGVPVIKLTLANITENHDLKAVFSNQYAITVTSDGNGTVAPAPVFDPNSNKNIIYATAGADTKLTFTPKTGYVVKSVTLDGTAMGVVNTLTIPKASADHVLDVTFEPKTYTIAVTQTTGGTVSANPVAPLPLMVGSGYNAIFDIAPAANYEVADVLVNGVSKGPVKTYVFTNVSADQNITALYSPQPGVLLLRLIGGGGALVGGLDVTLTLPVGASVPLNSTVGAPLNEIDPAALTAIGAATGAKIKGKYDPATGTINIAITKVGGFATGGDILSIRFMSTANPVGSFIAGAAFNKVTDETGALFVLPNPTLAETLVVLPKTVASPYPGTLYKAAQNVVLTTTPGATIYYTLNGVVPTTASNKYTNPILVSANTTIKYFAVDGAGNQESLRQDNYIIDSTPPTAILLNTPSLLTRNNTATITVTGADVVSYTYQLDSNPVSGSTPVTTKISLGPAIPSGQLPDGAHSLKVYGMDSAGNLQTSATQFDWTVDTATPSTTASPAGGTYNSDKLVTLTADEAKATIYYTLDNTAPVPGTSLVYSSPILITKDTAIKFLAVDSAGNQEVFKTENYTILKLTLNPPLTPTTVVAPPTLKGTVSANPPPAGVSTTTVDVTITDPFGTVTGPAPATITHTGSTMDTWSYAVGAGVLKNGRNDIKITATYNGQTYDQTASIVYGTCDKEGLLSGTGVLSMNDVLLALRMAIGLVPPNTACADVYPYQTAGSPAPDGVVDVSDALLIMRKVVTGSW